MKKFQSGRVVRQAHHHLEGLRSARLARFAIGHDCAAHGRDQLPAMRVGRQLGCAGGAAGVEIRRDVISLSGCTEAQAVARLGHQCIMEIDHARFRRRAGMYWSNFFTDPKVEGAKG